MVDFYKTFLFLNYGLLLTITFLVFLKFTILNKKEKQYVYYIVFLFLIEVISLFFAYVLELKDTSFLYPFYIVGEFLLLTSLFITKLDLPKYAFGIISFAALLFLIVNSIPKLIINNDEVKVASNIIIICFAGFTLLQQIKTGKNLSRFTLIDACIFFYYSVSVFFFIVQQQLKNLSEDNFYMILGVNNVLSSILYCSIIYTFLKLKK
ncbi:hypothetical protein DRF62_08490 [Chryseobacterium piscium]|uniref:YhhN-like protein n=1 Tax=Chryseobacterium piscium TaxID=333702 RepID=A0A3D9BMI1_9FLAO|nr:hypothetical protein DRF62_08490 [Chryseobacterium piscium]